MSAQNHQKDSFAKARESMVVSQLQPAGITNERVVEAYRAVERENFIPDNLKSVCYLDECINLGQGKVLLEPMLHGWMVSELNIKAGETALIVGDDTGYSKAILEHLGASVTATAGSYDIVLVNGAVSEISNSLTDRLNTGGRLACIVVPFGKAIGTVVIVTKEASGALAKQVLKDAAAPYVPGYEPKPGFTF